MGILWRKNKWNPIKNNRKLDENVVQTKLKNHLFKYHKKINKTI